MDTVGPPGPYASLLQGHFPQVTVTVSSKADSLYPVVSAASICAKVIRDSSLRAWRSSREREGGEGEGREEVGSGYPGDPTTKRWLDSHLDPIFGFEDVVRFSWKTVDEVLEGRGAEVAWAHEDRMELEGWSSKKRYKAQSPAAQRASLSSPRSPSSSFLSSSSPSPSPSPYSRSSSFSSSQGSPPPARSLSFTSSQGSQGSQPPVRSSSSSSQGTAFSGPCRLFGVVGVSSLDNDWI